MTKYTLAIVVALFFVCCNKVTDGYTNKVAYFPHETIELYLNASSNGSATVSLYNVNREVVDEIEVDLKKQPDPDTISWYKTGYQYDVTATFSPAELKSGVYYFKNSSPFVVKNPEKKNDVLVVYPSNTINAYNQNGGRSSYTKPIGVTLSEKRPTRLQSQLVAFLQWISKQPYNVDYVSDRELDELSNFQEYKMILIPGHSEYWTRKARRNFDSYINNGGNALILSGNTMWKQVRYDEDKVVFYSDYYADSLYPDTLRTSNYAISYLKYPIKSSIGLDFVRGGYGLEKDSGWEGYKIVNQSILLDKTNLKPGDIVSNPTVEYDGAKLVFFNGIPSLDTSYINFYKQKLIGYDRCFRITHNYGAFIVFKKYQHSGIIINVGSNTWCSKGFEGEDGNKIRQITANSIEALLEEKNLCD